MADLFWKYSIMSTITEGKVSKTPALISAIFGSALSTEGVSQIQRPFYHRWVSQYYDFCERNGFPVTSPDSLAFYLSHVRNCVAEPWRREQAEKAVRMFLDICKQENNHPQRRTDDHDLHACAGTGCEAGEESAGFDGGERKLKGGKVEKLKRWREKNACNVLLQLRRNSGRYDAVAF